MSDAELFRPQPETSNMPIVLASVISLTLHGLLWVVPPISMSRQKSDTQRTVGLVQLTPEEIGRIQEFSDSAVSLPPLPPTLPSTDVLPPPLLQQPSTPSLQQQEELVRQQIVQRQQRLLQRQLQQQDELLRQQQQRQDELIQKQKLQQQEALRRQIEQEKQRQTETLRREFEQEKQRLARLRSQQEQQNKAEFQRQQEQEKQRQEQERRQQEQEKQREELVRRQLELELLDQWEKQEKEFISPLKKQLQGQQKIERIKAIHGYDSSGTTEREGTEKLNNWFQEKITQFPGIKLNNEQNTRVVKSTAKVQLPDVTQASVALLVNPEGKPEGEPLLMVSTSYSPLNQAVIEDAKKRSFEPTGKYEIYMYPVNIDQSNLPATL